MGEMVQIIVTVLGTLGGFELVKWLFTRKSSRRVERANADVAETNAERDEFSLLRERLEFGERQLLEKEQRFQEQTELVRSLNTQLLEKTVELGRAEARIASLEAERTMKLCERRGCCDRIPQSGY